MYPIPWYVALLVSVPQTFLILLIGFKLYDIDMPLQTGLMVSVFMGFLAYIVRLFPMPFGLHTLIQITMLVVLISLMTNIKWWQALIANLTGVMITGIFESTLMPFFLMLTGKTISDFEVQPWLNVLSFLPLALLLIFFYLGMARYDLVVYQFKEDKYGL
ncbi:MAG TPA: hypothetical protein DER33_05465 [Syntrophomonas sp.]|jgi:hypothetical protein|nr:hypothetical protein [Syntrophomonas sp.]HCF71027.1 hypothetical protein [Syntrophomonas sp.]